MNEEELPGVLLIYDGVIPSDVLDGAARVERYRLALLAPIAGADRDEKAIDLADLERRLLDGARGVTRQNTRWDHMTAEITDADRSAGASLWRVQLIVRGD